ncbi:MAG: LysR family transcriptional regulator [Acidobacteria bacterium]|nr:LysR family transcriptional regulator [Acidobacteriota bacterium]
MPLDHLKLFRDIAHTRSVSRGAALNGVSQSAASQQLQELERQMDVPLLDRSTRPLTVTDAGRLYLDYCKDVLRRREDFEAALDRMKHQVEGVVRVAAIYSVGLSEMSELEQRFTARHPGASLQVEYLRPEKIYEAVLADRVDLGLVSYPEPNRELTVLPWRQEEMMVVTSPYHPLAALRRIRPADLNGIDFIGFDDDLPIQQAVRRYLEEHGVTVRMVMHFDNLQMIKEAVTQRAGVSIMPARVVQAELAQGRLAAVPLSGGSLFRPVGIIHRKKKRFSGAALAFLEMLQESPAPVLVGIE